MVDVAIYVLDTPCWRAGTRTFRGCKRCPSPIPSRRTTAGFESLEEADKVLVRSNGVATYVAKDIAYHLWKYGLLDRTFG